MSKGTGFIGDYLSVHSSVSCVPSTVRAVRVLNCSPRIYHPKKESGRPMSVWVSVCVSVCVGIDWGKTGHRIKGRI